MVLQLCSGPFQSQQQRNCRTPGNGIWENSTEGGEASELYYLMDGLKNSVLPKSVCTYQPFDGEDEECFGLEKSLSLNPLRFNITGMETYYDDLTVKTELFAKKTAMTFTTAMPYITHYYPCVGKGLAKDSRCDPYSNECTLCPPELSMTTCCIPIKGGSNYNMAGEFISHRGMTLEGGHVMVLAGYNDAFRTKDGFTGGYILKNSWFDGIAPPLGPRVARGSHSVRYWMQVLFNCATFLNNLLFKL